MQRMRTRLRKDLIQNWKKMKKYLKRQFLPPDYQDLIYQEYQNCTQLCNSVSGYTKSFYRPQSYLDLNESEEYSISRYKNGLRYAIRAKLSTQSFYCLFDLVLAATHVERLVERIRSRLWKQQKSQSFHDNTTNNIVYPVVAETQGYCSILCNPQENASTLSLKVSANHSGHDSNIPSQRLMANFMHSIKDE